MYYEVLDASELDDKLRRSLDQKVQGMESRGFELYQGLSQRDALIAVSGVLDKAREELGDDVLRARTDMSKVKLPMGPDLDSRFGRLSKGLSTETPLEFLELIEMVTKDFVREVARKPSWIWLNRDSNIGAPSYSVTAPLRIEAFRDGLKRYSKGEQLTFQAFRGIRKQADSLEKDEGGVLRAKRRDFAFPDAVWREVQGSFKDPAILDLKYDQGYTFGKTPVEADAPFSGPARVRGVKAMSYIDNSLAMVLRQTILDPADVSASIWKHRGLEDVYLKAKDKFVYCTDFSNYDQTVTYDELAVIERVLAEGFPDLGPLIRQMFESVYNMELSAADLLRPPLASHRIILYYRTTFSQDGICGIPSGWGITDVIGKIIGTAFGAYVLSKLDGRRPSSLKDLEGRVLNCGDDLVIMTDSRRDDEIDKIIEEQTFKKVRRESEAKFLGNIFMTDANGRVTSHVPSYISFFVNSMCPERQAGTGMRPYPEYGLRERYRNILQILPPNDRIAALIHEFYARLTQNIPDFEEMADEQELSAKQNQDLQYILDKYGLKDKEEIYYRLSIKDLPKEDAQLIGILVPSIEIVTQCPQLGPYFSR